MLVDSHCHLNCLDLEKLGLSLDEVIAHAQSQGVSHCLCIAVDLAHVEEVLAIAERYPNVYATVGMHPSETADAEPEREAYWQYVQHPKVVAMGEMGLDYYYNKTGLEAMRQRFRLQVELAQEWKKPIVIHTRDAREDTLAIMREAGADGMGGVMHCFTESWEMAQAALDMGFYIAFSGIVTFKNADDLREVALKVPLDRLLVETDAPYLTPVPLRGKPNQPANVRYVAEHIATLRGCALEEIAEISSANFFRCFRIEPE